MADVTFSGEAPVEESVLMMQRPAPVHEAIQKLLTEGDVGQLCSKEGQFLAMFFTPGETERAIYLPMPDCPNYNGMTCDYCAGRYRFANCQMCHGIFDPSVQAWGEPDPNQKAEFEAAVAANQARSGKSPFWTRIREAFNVLKGG